MPLTLQVFSGDKYWRFDDAVGRVELDYPRDISMWRGVPSGPSMSFYPDFIQILPRFYPDFILVLSRFYPNFLETHFIQILSRFYLDKIRIKFGGKDMDGPKLNSIRDLLIH